MSHYKHGKAYKQNKYTAIYQQNERLHNGKQDSSELYQASGIRIA